MAEGHDHTTTEDSLPDLPQRKLTEQPLLSRSRQHTLSAPGMSLYDTRSQGSSRCSSPRLKRSSEFIRISRNEWEQREKTLSSMRTEKNEICSIFRQQCDLEKNYQQLQKACLQLAHILGCTAISEISGETITLVVYPKAANLVSDISVARKQTSKASEDLANVRGELASVSAKYSNSKTQIHHLKTTLSEKDTNISHLKNEVEQLKQTEAHTKTMLQTLHDDRKLLESKIQNEDSNWCEKHNELTTLKHQLRKKENELASTKDEICTLALEKTELQERCLISDTAYEELCIHVAETLQIDQSDSCDVEKLLTKICNLVEECKEQRLKIESLSHVHKATELDSKANRETILRLVSDVKKYEEQVVDTSALQKKLTEMIGNCEKAEKDKTSLCERLNAAQSSVLALQQEIKAKEKNQEDLRQVIQELRLQNSRDDTDNILEQYMELCNTLRHVLKCTSDEMLLTSINQLIKNKKDLELQLMDSEKSNNDSLKKLQYVNDQLKETEEQLVTEQLKIADLCQQADMCEMLHSKVQELDSKHEKFLKQMIKQLKIESGVVLVGDFSEDAILVRIEQLSKLESQAVLEKKSAYYSVQRKLKSCRQQLEAKELQLELSQRKISVFERKLSEVSHKEIEWNATIDKGRRVERHIERLQEKIMKQQEIIGNLKIDSEMLERLKVDSQQMEVKMKSLEGQIENLQRNKIHLSQQLAEARHKAQTIANQDKKRADISENLLEETRQQLRTAIGVQNELIQFKTAVKQLISTFRYHDTRSSSHEPNNLLEEIEKIIMECNRFREMCHGLQASLKQLEMGFKRGYQDTLTLLNTN